MNFDLTEEQHLLQDGARRFIHERYGFETRRNIVSSTAGYSSAHWTSFAELGWLALSLPEDAGGLGLSFVDMALLLEEFGRGLVVEPFLSSVVLGARILERAATPRALALLEAIATGLAKVALAHDEPGERHCRDIVTTMARPTSNGFILNGAKIVVFDGPSADYLIISAQLEGDGVLALFLLEMGVTAPVRTAYPLVDGTRALDCEFQDLVLPADALLAKGGIAVEIFEEALDRATLGQAAESIGAMEAVLQLTSDYIKTRMQFGQPIGKFQALQHRMAEMFTDTQSARSLLFHGLSAIDAPAPARAAAISAAKVGIMQAGKSVTAHGMQLHGGMGMTDEVPVGHYFKRLIALEKAYGDIDWHLARFTQLSVC